MRTRSGPGIDFGEIDRSRGLPGLRGIHQIGTGSEVCLEEENGGASDSSAGGGAKIVDTELKKSLGHISGHWRKELLDL